MGGVLEGQVAIVTGAGRGFGRAIALRLAAEGAAVTVVSRSRDQLDAVVNEIVARGGRAVAAPADVTSSEDVARAAITARNAFGPVTLLVNNAGVPGPFGPLWEVDSNQWWSAQAVHIKAPVMLMSEVLPGMVANQNGRIIIVSALAARMVAPYMSAYCTGKIAQCRLVEEIAVEAGAHGVFAFAIDPGFVFTGIAEQTMNDPAAQKWMPAMVDRLREKSRNPDSSGDLQRCAQRCVDLASGRYDGLTGRYMELADDLDAMLQGARPHWQDKGRPLQPSPEQRPGTREQPKS